MSRSVKNNYAEIPSAALCTVAALKSAQGAGQLGLPSYWYSACFAYNFAEL